MAFDIPISFGTKLWGAREGDDQGDPQAPLAVILPGELDAPNSAQARIWYAFKQTDSWPLLMAVLGDLWAEQELALGSVDLGRYLSTAEGDVLDLVGEKVGRTRSGLSDDLYRLAIRAEAGSIVSDGTIPDMVALTRELLGEDVVITEIWPRTVIISAPDVDRDVFVVMLEVLSDVPVVTVGALLETWEDGLVYGWGSTTDPLETEIPIAGEWSSTTGVDADSGPALWSDMQPIL